MNRPHPHSPQSIDAHRDWLFATVEQWVASHAGLCQNADNPDEFIRVIRFADGLSMLLAANRSLDFADLVVFAPVSIRSSPNHESYLYSLAILCSAPPEFSRARFDSQHQFFAKAQHLSLLNRQELEQSAVLKLEQALWYVSQLASYLTEITERGCLSAKFGKALHRRFIADVERRWPSHTAPAFHC